MRAGNLKHKIIFQETGSTQNDFGEIIDSKIDVLTTFASINPISGKESFLSNQAFSTVSHKLKVRYSNKINAKQKIKHNERIFNIISVLNYQEANKELEILVEEALND